ncbi:type II secretion system protein GspC [Vulgatibacter sp.]|uniref:type II secretion system protein GspC n=1 Tax=Vulgatibacter sp. TaxID=1971226 RepID=UPI0035698063
MELLFRKYFWSVNLAFLALAGLLAARTVNTFVAAQLAPPVRVQAADAGKRTAPPRLGLASINLEQTARVFGIELPKEEPAEVAATPAFDPNAEPVKSSLRASLIGTMVANRNEWSFATIRDDSNQNVGMYLPGDQFMGAEILSVDRLRVILLNQGRKEFLAIGDAAAPVPAVAAPVAAAPASSSGEGINQVDENNYVIPREEIDKQLSNLNSIATQARIVPSFKNGTANGFKLFSIRPGSIYSKIGIQNGDVIRRINGYEINSPDKALEVYTKLKESSKIEIELERRGKPVTKSYSIQ